MALPLASSFPWMAGATVATVVIGVIRFAQRNPDRAPKSLERRRGRRVRCAASALGTAMSTKSHARRAGRHVTAKSAPASPYGRRGTTGTAKTVIALQSAPRNVTGAVRDRNRRPAASRPRPRAVHRVRTATASAVNEVTEASAEETAARPRHAVTRRHARVTRAADRNKADAPATE